MLLELLTKRYPGMRFWLLQRITAVIMAIYLPFAMVYAFVSAPSDYAAWLAFNQPWWWRLSSVLFFVSLSLHAWVGLRDVFRDYIPNPVLQDWLQILVEVSLMAYLIWSAWIFWSI